MLLHILKIIRTEFRSNLWVLAELLVVSVVLWISIDYFSAQYQLYHKPVGYETEHVYEAVVSMKSVESPSFVTYEQGSEEPYQNFSRIIERIRQHPDVESVAIASYSLPYTYSNRTYGVQKDTTLAWQSVRMLSVSPEYFQVFHITPANGGKPEDLGERLQQEGTMISATLAEDLFGRTNVVGEKLFFVYDSVPKPISAVTEAIRNDEYDDRSAYNIFQLLTLEEMARQGSSEKDYHDLQVVFRTRANVPTKDFADKFLSEMHQQLKAGNYWVSDIQSYDTIRKDFLARSSNASGQQVMSSVIVFLLVNVFLALIGTFWFHVNRRREEIGLRMAIGSSRNGILCFFISEGLLLLTLSMIPALLICLNLLSAEVIANHATTSAFGRFCAVSLATWIVLAITILIAVWYPARKASGMNPADALHYE